jgi:hypothetical protein
MNLATATSVDQIWHSPTLPIWLTLAAASCFAVIVLVALLRADRSVANGALVVITLLAVGTAGAATMRGVDAPAAAGSASTQPARTFGATLPALSCIDDLAGEAVLTACEKILFGSAESTAAAVSYTASRITQLTTFGVASADRNISPELQALRGAIERDRYGLAAYVLLVREHCTPDECSAFRSLIDHNKIVANMDQRVYEGLVSRYAPTWNAPAVVGPLAGLPSTVPTGRPTNAEFPSAASTPAVSIMAPEPAATASTRVPATAPPRPAAPPPAPAATSAAAAPALAAAKKPPPKPRPAAPPVQLAPATATPAPVTAPAPAATNE